MFVEQSVTTNLELGCYRSGVDKDVVAQRLERTMDLFPVLRKRANQRTSTMSGGEQQMVAIGRALMSEPRLLVLDEPSMGLAPKITGEVFDALERLRSEGLSILLIEQNAPLAFELADRGYLMRQGSIVVRGHDRGAGAGRRRSYGLPGCMTGHAAPLSPQFRADLARMEAEDLGPVGVPGALHLGEPPNCSPGSRRSGGSRAGPPSGPVRAPQGALAERLRQDRATTPATVRAWAHVDPAYAARSARAAALEIESGTWRGPLHGVPVGVKDVIDVAGMPTAGGSAYLLKDRGCVATPVVDAGSVAMLRRAGAVVVGKTCTHEFAFGGTTPPTRNPHDLDRIPGGSSGGSAAAVAAGHVRVALGSDTGGSVRIPPAYCGVAGLVPSPGLLPVDGTLPLAWSMDRVGVIAAEVRDLVGASLALGLVPRVDRTSPFEGLRIGVPRGTFDGAVDEAVVARRAGRAGLAEKAGAELVEVEIPHQWAAVTAGMALILGEGAEEQRARRADREDLFGDDVRAMLAMADQVSAATYVRAQRLRAVIRRELLRALDAGRRAGDADDAVRRAARRGGRDRALCVGGHRSGWRDAHLRYNIGANLAALPCGTQPLPAPRGRAAHRAGVGRGPRRGTASARVDERDGGAVGLTVIDELDLDDTFLEEEHRALRATLRSLRRGRGAAPRRPVGGRPTGPRRDLPAAG